MTEPEKDVPGTVTVSHVGSVVICKIPHSASLVEGEITSLSPGGKFFRIGKSRWLENGKGNVLSVLECKKKTRASAL